MKYLNGELWSYEQSRENMLKFIPKGGIGIELGVFKAKFSRILVDTLQPTCLHLVDPWAVASTGPESQSVYGKEDMDQIFQRACDTMAEEIASGQVIVWRARGEDVLPNFSCEFDWAYIDASNKYASVDYNLWHMWERLKVGGYIMGANYRSNGWWGRDVIFAVNEFIGLMREELDIVYIEGGEYLLRKIQ